MPYYYLKQMAQERLNLRAMQLNEAAESLPHGDEREALLQRARRMEAASTYRQVAIVAGVEGTKVGPARRASGAGLFRPQMPLIGKL